jgi:Na+-transporting NADH:ubiquinone oxidoreductase subunit F
MPTVTFHRTGKKQDVVAGATILAAANRCDVPIGQSCSGDGICGWCKVEILEGLADVLPPAALERRLMQEKEFGPRERAACLAKVKGDVTVTTTYW